MKLILLTIFTLFTLCGNAQSNPNSTVSRDTTGDAADLDAFLKELSAMMDTMPASAFAGFSTTLAGKDFPTQIKELMDAANNNFSSLYSKSSFTKERHDSVFTTLYRFDNADKNEIRREITDHYTFTASWNNITEIDDASKIYDRLLSQFKTNFQSDYTFDERTNKFFTELTPKKKDNGRNIYLSILPVNNKYQVSVKVRHDLTYRDPDAFDPWKN